MKAPSTELLELSPKLIFDLASKMNPPEVVAQEHDLDPHWMQEFIELPHIKRAIKEKQAELDAAGYSLVQKSRLMFEDGLTDVYRKMKDPTTSLSALVETMKFLRTVAQLDKQDAGHQSEKFSINIVFSGAAPGRTTIDVQASSVEDAQTVTIDLPQTPSYISSIQSNNELAYYEET